MGELIFSTLPEKARDYEAIASRQNKRLAARAPLLALAGVLQQRTPQDIIDAEQRFDDKMTEATARIWQHGLLFRELTFRLSEPGTVERLDGEWEKRKGPHACEYYADFWRQAFTRHAT